MLIAIDESRDYYAELQARLKAWDAERKAMGLPRIIHNHTRYIQGKTLNTETGLITMHICPPKGSEAYEALRIMPWNKNAVGQI